jgi:hypothetical protein
MEASRQRFGMVSNTHHRNCISPCKRILKTIESIRIRELMNYLARQD